MLHYVVLFMQAYIVAALQVAVLLHLNALEKKCKAGVLSVEHEAEIVAFLSLT